MEKKISCCVNTFKRPDLLKKLLVSLNNQILENGWELEVIVVDNDSNKSGNESVLDFQKKYPLKVKYFSQKIKNISLTRNKAVQKASGDYIFFIDDDGIAANNWIQKMLNCLDKYNADGVFGTVLPFFDDDAPKWVHKSPFFNRLTQKTGEPSKYYRTGNCLVKAEWLKKEEGPFDPAFGLTGGEDSALFGKLKSHGAKLIFCKEGIVHDYFPNDRANLKWLINRFYRTGNTSIQGKINKSNIKLITRIFYFFRSLIILTFCLIFLILFLPSNYYRHIWLVKSASYFGHLMAVFNVYYEGY